MVGQDINRAIQDPTKGGGPMARARQKAPHYPHLSAKLWDPPGTSFGWCG